jgi:hypothetical protein
MPPRPEQQSNPNAFAAIRAALRRMLDDDAHVEQVARAFRGLLKR